VIAAVGLAACAAPAAADAAPAAPAAVEPVRQDELVPGPTFRVAYVARVVRRTFTKDRPWGRKRRELGVRAPWGGGSNQLLVLDSLQVVRSPEHPETQRLWLKVALPRRPNGTTGWVPADHMQVSSTRWRINISTEKKLVQVFHDGRLRQTFRAIVGARGTPTPHGLFAINEAIRQPNPRAFLGPWALHLTAFSNVLDDYGGGPGRVAIHGRGGASLRDPLGSARSHGCVRIENRRVRFLARAAQAGTPVRITSDPLRVGRDGRAG